MFNTGSYGPSVLGCTFTGNMVYYAGGALYNDAMTTVNKCRFQGNAAVRGGAVFDYYTSTSSLANSIFDSNRAGNGGAIYNDENATTIRYCVFLNNVATSNLSMGYGGAIYNSYGSTTPIVNCTFYGNNAVTGGALYNESSASTLENVIAWGNTATSAPSLKVIGSSYLPYVSFSDIEGGCTYTSLCTRNNMPGNIDADPKFVDAAGGNLQLQGSSPCVDTGNTSNYAYPPDILGQSWVDIQGIGNEGSMYTDMGAYEYHQ